MFKQISILGPGLLGASILKTVKRLNLCHKTNIWSRRKETRDKCVGQPWCDEVFSSPEDAIKQSDLVIICTPVGSTAPLLTRIAPFLSEDCIITDVGSTKSCICRQCADITPSQSHFIGSHPIAGSEKTGLEHATSDLFSGKTCFITPTHDSNPEIIKRLTVFWENLGMHVTSATPEDHDNILSSMSHLPHLIASALCNHLNKQDSEWAQFAGTGLKDTTRIAAGSPEMWVDIFSQNKAAVINSLNLFKETLDEWHQSLKDENMDDIAKKLRMGKDYRDKLE